MTERTAERIAHALERIADVLEQATAAPTPHAQDRCAHPMDARVDFGGMGELGGYQCTACGEHIEPQKVNAHV